MSNRALFITLISLLFTAPTWAMGGKSLNPLDADWSEEATLVPGEPRENIYNQAPGEFKASVERGYGHALKWPVPITGLIVPYDPLKYFLESDERNPIQELVYRLSQKRIPFKDMQGLYDWLGLNPFNDEDATGIYRIPYPDGVKPDYPMGASLIKTEQGLGLTFSCATCHTASLFGKTVMGLTNKRVRANEFFVMAKQYIPHVPSPLFKWGTNATEDERLMFRRTKYNLPAIGAVRPQVLGLDTSLPQVALSLSRRGGDEYATRSSFYENFPRKNKLDHYVADSKPAVWWNLKHKTRWLSDGSIISGNPVFTNFLWNELGRGTDLKELEAWMRENPQAISDLTAAVFATKPPRWTDFFDASTLNLARAKRGQALFNESCKKCHGEYQKAWDGENADTLIGADLFATTKVVYFKRTPIRNVGTDPQRAEGMKAFADRLNELAISKWMKTVVEPQDGYVPPPLEGIWARYPYFHNNSVPNLCALLTKASERPKEFYQGPAVDPETDFDSECVGYPVGDQIPVEWKKEEDARFDTSKPGLRNTGHEEMFLNADGSYKLSETERLDLIHFLKTL